MVQFFVNVDRDNRQHLTEEQQHFLKCVVPLSEYIQEQTVLKCEEDGKYTYAGIFPSVCAGICIYKSQWGTHPAAHDRVKFADGTWENANNLALMETEEAYVRTERRAIKVGTKSYKSFFSWGEFAVAISDRWAWTHDYSHALAKRNWYDQLKCMQMKDNDSELFARVEFLIKTYRLSEFDC